MGVCFVGLTRAWCHVRKDCMKFCCMLLGFGCWIVGGVACSHLFQPEGSGDVPELGRLEERVKGHVYYLADDVGERTVYHEGTLEKSAAYIERELCKMGYEVRRQPVFIANDADLGYAAGKTVYNLQVTKRGYDPKAKTLVVGAHYDTWVGKDAWNAHGGIRPARVGTPGANDNGTGVAALLEMARFFKDVPTKHSVNFVAYVNEEPPFFQTDSMGSAVHARSLVRELGKDKIMGMIALETLGCYSPRVNNKRKTALIGGAVGLPDRCDYVAFLSTNSGRKFAVKAGEIFQGESRYPLRITAFPYLSKGMAWSDDWAYMKQGIPALCATDTAFMRCDDYHETSDTADKIDYPQFAEVVYGLTHMVRGLVNE